MPSCIHKYPHGRPLLAPDPSDHHSSNSSRISVASFNLLAPLYIRPIDQRTGKIQPFASFDWISDEDSERILGNERRLPKLLQCMQDCGCDFICVQELQLEREEVVHDSNSNSNENGRNGRSRKEDCDGPKGSPQFVLPKWITPLIQCSTSSDGNKPYGIILPQQTELDKIAERNRRVLLADVAITNAIFYRSDKWKPNQRKGEVNGSSTTTCVMQAFLSDESSDPIVISSIHLDACSEVKRVQQLQRCLEISVLSSGTAFIPPCVIAGDFNATCNRVTEDVC